MAPSLSSLFSFAGKLFSQVPLLPPGNGASDVAPFHEPLSGAPSCPLDGPLSCHNSTPVPGDSCCFVHPGGRMLLTQFWDTHVHQGRADEDWTLHGLWPDLCDGTYDQYCHMTPSFKNVTDILEHYEQKDLLAFMNRYWLSDYGPNSNLWEHEFNKHGTCINTLAPACYGASHQTAIEVVDYFTRATSLFRTLDTYRALERAGITPHPKRHYPLLAVQDALERFSGGKVVLRCTGRRNVLHEAWYVYFVKGSLQTGEFVPAQDSGREKNAGNCAPWVRYPPKKGKSAEL